MQRPGPAVQTNSLVTKGKGIVTMILNVVRKRKNFNVASTIAYKWIRVPDLIQAQIVALIQLIVTGLIVHGAVVPQKTNAKKEMGTVTMTVNVKTAMYVAETIAEL